MSDSEMVPEAPPGSSQQLLGKPGLVQQPPFGAMAGIMPPEKLVTTGNSRKKTQKQRNSPKINTSLQATVMTSLRKATQGSWTCKFCGKAHPFRKGKCPKWGVKCTKCSGRNHFAKTCTTPTRKVYNLRDEFSDGSNLEYITSIVAQPEMIQAVMQEHDYPKVIYTEMFVDKIEVKF